VNNKSEVHDKLQESPMSGKLKNKQAAGSSERNIGEFATKFGEVKMTKGTNNDA